MEDSDSMLEPEDFDDQLGRSSAKGTFQNLYEILHSTIFNHKKTEGKDVGPLSKLVTPQTRQTFRCVDIAKNLEHSCFSIVLTDMNDQSRLIAHASFNDSPTDPQTVMTGKRWKKNPDLARFTTTNTLFMTIFVYREEEGRDQCMEEIVANTFGACESIDYILLECPEDTFEPGGYIFSPQVTEIIFKAKSDILKKLIVYSKDVLLPKLRIRPGRDLDLDDLSPLIYAEPALLQETFNKSFLVELISMSERTKHTIVAEFDGYAVGMIVVSSNTNYALLNQEYHLEPFHNLYKPSVGDEVNCHTETTCLFEQVKPYDIRIRDTFDQAEGKKSIRNESLSEDPSLQSKKVAVVPSDASIPSDDEEIVQDGEDERTMQEFIKSLEIANANSIHAGQGDADQMNAETAQDDVGTTLKFVNQKFRYSSIVNEGKNSSELNKGELLNSVHHIMKKLATKGQTIRTGMLDTSSIRTLTKAQEYINSCIQQYLHKVLLDEKLLPICNVTEPEPSTFAGLPNALTLQLLTLDKRYHIRVQSLIQGAFAAFPTRDYLVLTTPCDELELPWMKYFVRVTPRTRSINPKNLYILHRACFTNTIRVRRIEANDLCNVECFLQTMHESKKIMEDVRSSICSTDFPRNTLECFIVDVTTHPSTPIIGIVVISKEDMAPSYQINYDLDRYTYFDLHSPFEHGYVHHFILNPIFQPQSKIVMKEVIRITRMNCLYHKIYPISTDPKITRNQCLLNNLDDWIGTEPRRRVEYSLLNLVEGYDDLRQPPKKFQAINPPFSLFHYSKKLTYEPKLAVPKRVVFVGASDTILSCLSKILSTPYFDWKNFTLISKHGLPGSLPKDEIRNMFFPRKNGPALSMKSSEEWYQRLPIRPLVNIVYGTVVRILRKVKVVILDGNKVVPYDLLVIGTGRQFMRPDSPHADIVDERLEQFHQSLIKNTTPDKVAKEPLPEKPKNVIMINTELDASRALALVRSFIPFVSNRQIIVHGACLEAYCCIRALIELGVAPSRITFVIGEQEEMQWEARNSFRDTIQIRQLMDETFEQLGIQMIRQYEFRRWNVDPASNICSRVYFFTTKYAGTDRPQKISVPCLAYFPFCLKRVGDEISSAIASAAISYCDAILVNMKFETDDPNIMAAGTCTSYDKKLCAGKFDHPFFSSYEIGQLLGEFILQKIAPPKKSVNVNFIDFGTPNAPPQLHLSLVHYAELPGSWYYLHVSEPSWIPNCCRQADCTCSDCSCGTEIVTGSTNHQLDPEQRYFRLRLDKYNCVNNLECISRRKFPPSCLASLFGHHASFLNKLLEKLEKEEINDLYQHFCQPWVAALTTDRWLTFRKEIQKLIETYEIGKDIKMSDFVRDYIDNLDNSEVFQADPNILRHVFENTNLKAAIETKFLNFLKYNKAVLPMYARPDFVEETYKERLSSPFYVPLHKNFSL